MIDETLTSSRRTSPLGGAERLVILWSPHPDERGRAMVLGEAPLHIGRAPAPGGVSLVLKDGTASRQHAVIELADDGAKRLLKDNESRNGTFVDGQQVREATLANGSIVRIGDHLLLYQVLDSQDCLRLLDPPPADSPIIGGSPKLLRIHHEIRAIARKPFPVLILGESGVGKELIAQSIHEQSGRKGMFVPVNCAALPENLIESELFGHVRGAFTDATARRGLFKQAEGGTIFLDEIGDLRLDLQAKLLRVLATGEVRKVGDDRAEQVDVRVVAATNVDLQVSVQQGGFRGDLFSRMMEYVIEVPALRERRDDILDLFDHFLRRENHAGRILVDAAEAVLVYDWPYNVRELEQVARSVALYLTRDEDVNLDHLPSRVQAPFAARMPARNTGQQPPSPLLTISRTALPSAEEFRAVLQAYDGNVSNVAAFFRRNRRHIYRWAESFGIDLSEYRKRDELEDGD